MSKRNRSRPSGSDLRSISPTSGSDLRSIMVPLPTRSVSRQFPAIPATLAICRPGPKTGGARSAMSTAHPSFLSSVVLLETYLLFGDEEEPVVGDWVVLPCVGRGAYGDLGLRKGFKLVARLAVPPHLSQMRLRVSEDVVGEKGYVRSANILSAHKDLMLIHVTFQRDRYGCYLVYDAADASLSMVPHPYVSNPEAVPRHTAMPLIFRRDDGTYALVYLAAIKTSLHDDCLCVWPPPPQPSLASSSNILPWYLKVPVYPEAMPTPRASGFFAHKVFSFQGKAFWADLTRGILYCELADLLCDTMDRVPFHFISLPSHDSCPEDDVLPQTLLTIGCIGGSIKFAFISTITPTPTTEVAMWTLTSNLQEWQEDGRLLLADLYKQQKFVRAGLPASPKIVTTPVLSLHPRDEDGVLLCLLMGCFQEDKEHTVHFNEQHMLCIDMRSNQLHSSAPLPSDRFFFVPSIIFSDIFDGRASKHLLRLGPAHEDVAIATALEEESPSKGVSD